MIMDLEHEYEAIEHTFGSREQRTESNREHHHEKEYAPNPKNNINFEREYSLRILLDY
jgi:hypothetical protein